MRVEWHGQSAFTLEGEEGTVFVDPFVDMSAARERGYVFSLDGVRAAHFGDLRQAALRPEQREAIGEVDLAIVPVGGGPTIGGSAAAEIALSLGAKWAVPMHYRTHRIGFLEDEQEFAAAFPRVQRFESPRFDTGELEEVETGAVAVIPAAP